MYLDEPALAPFRLTIGNCTHMSESIIVWPKPKPYQPDLAGVSVPVKVINA